MNNVVEGKTRPTHTVHTYRKDISYSEGFHYHLCVKRNVVNIGSHNR